MCLFITFQVYRCLCAKNNRPAPRPKASMRTRAGAGTGTGTGAGVGTAGDPHSRINSDGASSGSNHVSGSTLKLLESRESVESFNESFISKIDDKLDAAIELWQQSINDYESYKYSCMEDSLELTKYLTTIESEPNSILADTSKRYPLHIIELAKRMMVVLERKNALGIEDTDKTISSQMNPLMEEGSLSKSGSIHLEFDVFEPNHKFSARISQAWAKRLEEIVPTQGEIHYSSVYENSKTLKLKPKWPDFLSNVCYEVIKRNRVGHRMARIIKLTEHHLLNIKDGDKISKVYPFNDMRRIWLEDNDTIILIMKNGKQLTFISSIASHIAQQIITRVKVRLQLDRTDFSAPYTIPGYTSTLTAKIIQNISLENSVGANEAMLAFANELREKAIRDSLDEDDQFSEATDLRPSFESSVQQSQQHRSLMAIDELLREEDQESDTGADEMKEEEENAEVGAHKSELTGEETPENREDGTSLEIENDIPTNLSVLQSFSENVQNDGAVELSGGNDTDRIPAEKKEDEVETSQVVEVVEVKAARAEEETEKVQLSFASDSISNSSISEILIASDPTHGSDSEINQQILVDSKPEESEFVPSVSSEVGLDSTVSSNIAVETAIYSIQSSVLSTPSSIMVSSPKTSPTKQPAPNFFAFSQGSREHKLFCEVQRILFDPKTPEGNTRNLFMDNFYKSVLNPAGKKSCLLDIRHFIDGMHRHILKKRGLVLSTFLAKGDSSAVNSGLTDIRQLDESILTSMSFIIFRVVEEAMFLPLKDEIATLLPSFSNVIDEENLKLRMKVFSKRNQVQWGIPKNVISHLGWKSAIFELSALESHFTPSMMLNTLARTAKAIYSEFKLAVVPTLSEKDRSSAYLSADDFVPVFIYVFCQTDLKTPSLNKEIMWSLCHPDQLHGECGYYLTAYESSIEFVLNENLTPEEMTQMSIFANQQSLVNESNLLSVSNNRSSTDRTLSVELSRRSRANSQNYSGDAGSGNAQGGSNQRSTELTSILPSFRMRRETMRQSFA